MCQCRLFRFSIGHKWLILDTGAVRIILVGGMILNILSGFGMNKSKYTLPYLPDSIAVGLTEDLLQYLIELKFLLLFFRKPHCIFANAGLQFLSGSAADDLRSNKKIRTVPWEEEEEEGIVSSELQNIDVILTEEWEETLSHCSPHYHEINLEVSDSEIEYESDHIFDPGDFIPTETEDDNSESELVAHLLRANMAVMIDTLEMCCNERIPMIWGDPADTVAATIFSKHLLDKYAKNSQGPEAERMSAIIRTIKGDDLLRSIFELEIVNLATAPIHKVIEFRKKNQDLLNSFLIGYRAFLTELQSDPLNYRKLVLGRTQKIVEDMNNINMELLALRKSEKYKWLERMSEDVFEGAKKGAIVAVWNLLASPILLAGEIGKSLLSAANFGLKDLKDRKQQEQALIFKSSSGYLWKAAKQFRE